MTIEQGVMMTLLLAVVSFAGAWGGASARLKRVEEDTKDAHDRIDEHLAQHIEGNL